MCSTTLNFLICIFYWSGDLPFSLQGPNCWRREEREWNSNVRNNWNKFFKQWGNCYCVASSNVTMWHYQMLLSDIIKCCCVTSSNVPAWHHQMFLCGTIKCSCVASSNVTEWHHQMLLCDIIKCYCVTSSNVPVWHHQMLLFGIIKCYYVASSNVTVWHYELLLRCTNGYCSNILWNLLPQTCTVFVLWWW
jgi:hypothetical protein